MAAGNNLFPDAPIGQMIAQIMGLQSHVRSGILKTLPNDKGRCVVESQPEGGELPCRWCYTAIEGRGSYHEPEVGDEVIVVFPDGEKRHAIAFPGPPSAAARRPEGLGPGLTHVHPEGTQVVLQAGNATQKAVVAPLPADLKDAWSNLKARFQALLVAGQTAGTAAGAPSPTAATVAAALQAYFQSTNATLIQLIADMAAFEAKMAQVDAYLSSSLETD